MKSKMNQLFEDERNVHVLYAYDGMENYLKQVMGFIDDGIVSGDHILLIENERDTTIIQKELSLKYSAEQLEFIHFVNSLNFYLSSGSYHPPAINEYFTKIVQPYLEKEQPFRSWAHVEWESVKEPLHLIEDFERIVDEAVDQYSFPLICAYEKQKMPEHLTTILMETHPYVLLEDDFIASSEYRKVNVLK
ncbi:MEDS domain-containing protein [Planococcus sp. X10-3]|uniref:MEDS domain-containing protein n=1 Tax=Planococcus sp. X10-3 TaxID=3061240 RepID=UPI003BB1789E